LSSILATGEHTIDRYLKPPGDVSPFIRLNVGYTGLEAALSNLVIFNGTISADSHCQEIVRGALALYGMDQVTPARKLAAMISSKDNFIKALTSIIRGHFGDQNWEPQRITT